jgi:hypothetical protein
MSKAPAKKAFREGGIVRPEEAKAKGKGNPFGKGGGNPFGKKDGESKLAPPFKKKGK